MLSEAAELLVILYSSTGKRAQVPQDVLRPEDLRYHCRDKEHVCTAEKM